MLMKCHTKEHSPAIHSVVHNDGSANCYVWPETEGNRGVNEVGTCLIDFALQKFVVKTSCHTVITALDRTEIVL